jgi:hypothetical protein
LDLLIIFRQVYVAFNVDMPLTPHAPHTYIYRNQNSQNTNEKMHLRKGCETWLLTLKEEHRLRVFENRVLRGIFGPKRDEVTGEWRRLHNKELYAPSFSSNIIWVIKTRRMRWAGHVACMGGRRGAYTVLVGRPEGRRPLGRPRCRWDDNIKMDLQEEGWGCME